MAKTKIDWTDWTCNCFWGCNQGCSYCAARSMAKRFGRRIGEARQKTHPIGLPIYFESVIHRMETFQPVFLPDQLWRIPKKPCKVFISFMGDWAADWFEDWQRKYIFQVIRDRPNHTFQILTKQPQNLLKWSPYPNNCYVGVSATNALTLDIACRNLFDIKAAVKFISLEPLLDWQPWFSIKFPPHISWIILGQCTPVSVKTQPKIEWVKEIIEAADKAKIPVFEKDNLKTLLHRPLRQEFPI